MAKQSKNKETELKVSVILKTLEHYFYSPG